MAEDNKKMPQAVQVSSSSSKQAEDDASRIEVPTGRELAWYGTQTYQKFDKAMEMIFEVESIYPIGNDIRVRLYLSRGEVAKAKYTAKHRYIQGENMP